MSEEEIEKWINMINVYYMGIVANCDVSSLKTKIVNEIKNISLKDLQTIQEIEEEIFEGVLSCF